MEPKLEKKNSTATKIEAGSQRHLWTAAGTKCRIPPKRKGYETKSVIQRKLYKIKKVIR
jgi:hypothetical protein